MSKIVLKSSLLVLLAIASCLVGCNPNVAGTVTDTGNTIAGVVYHEDGSVASDAIVRMARMKVADGVGMPEQLEVMTDSKGKYSFDSVLADTFQLAVIDASVAEIFYLPRTTSKSKDLGNIKLAKAAIFKSSMTYEDVAEPAVQVGSHFVVYVAGTPFHESVFAGDSFSVLIPEGDWWMEFFPGDPQIVAKLQESGVADSLIYRRWNMDGTIKGGDTLDVGPFIWSTTTEIDSLIKESEAAAKDVARLSGTVACKNGKPCEGVEVSLITDLFGFEFTEGDSLEFKTLTKTDSLGRWWLPLPKSVPEDSFRVEFRKVQDDIVFLAGTSRYVQKKEIAKLKDTLDIGADTLSKPSTLISGVSLVVDRDDTTQSSNCMVNSVVVGIKGTSHFVRDVTCNLLTLADLPKGNQEIVLYSGDPKVMSVLQKSDAPRWVYVTLTPVSLPEDGTQQQQWMTYSPPSLK
ncbi:MAG: carboxypeptidase-like regulatory domain-containing protein [Fibrobacter sp.]|nr:carboxypeptidase-like regulatory domain-containing protein [Fibrobacter sp.]